MQIPTPIYLFEYDIPLTQANLLNYCPGIWAWTITPGIVIVTDDNGNTGYYDTTNVIEYNVKSARQDELDLILVNSIDDCFVTDASFYYDRTTTRIYFHFKDFEPPLSKKITIGLPVGFSKNCLEIKPYFYDKYYAPRINKIYDVKKSIDRLFFGIPKFTTSKVSLNNSDGYFDNFGSLNLYGQPARILQGYASTDYLNYSIVTSGFISDYVYDWESIEIEIDDPRKGLTQPVARNVLNKTDYPYLSDVNVNLAKPVLFGTCFNVPLICLNSDETTPAAYNFLICDDEFTGVYDISYISGLIIDRKGENQTTVTVYTRSDNIIYIPATQAVGDSTIADYLDKVSLSVVEMDDSNAVTIIKYLMYFYDGKTYISTFWDTAEVDVAITNSPDIGIYITEQSEKLIDVLKKICEDINARFFLKWDGRYTVRLYDNNRTIAKHIYDSKWLEKAPAISNTGSEFLSSCIIKYNFNFDEKDHNYQYEETDYKILAHDTYKRYKVETFNTKLINESGAIYKAAGIMQQSYNVGDVVARSILAIDNDYDYSSNLEITDFIVGNPKKRTGEIQNLYGDSKYLYDTIEYNLLGIYEILGMVKNVEDNELKLTLRYVKKYSEA